MTVTTALIGLAHGSRHPGVTGPIEELMSMASKLTGAPGCAAYLDLTEPDLTTVAAGLAADGIRRAVVVPLLFTNAYHARIDVPATIADAGAVAGLELRTAGILGTGDDVAAVVAATIDDAEIPAGLPVLLYAVGSSDASANSAVTELGRRLAVVRGAAVGVAFGTTDPRPEPVLAQLAANGLGAVGLPGSRPGAVGLPAGRPGAGGPSVGGRVAIVPLFVSPGLLLDPLADLARDRGLPMTGPLGRRLAPVVAARFAAAVS